MPVMATDTKKDCQFIGSPRMHHLKPSITPTIGFKEYQILHFSAMALLLKPIGVMNKPNWMINGMIYLKSRYFTFTAVRYKPTPKAQKNANNMNRGKKIICQEGTNLNQMNITKRMIKDIAKSTRLVITDHVGIIILGK